MSLGCGCGCKGKGGPGSCMDVTASFPPVGGVIPRAYMGGMQGLGSDTTTCISYDADGNCIDTVTTPDSGLITSGTSIPSETTIPVVMQAPTPVNTTTSNPVSPFEAQMANTWSNIFGSILKSQAGANPSYQSIGPNGTSTTIYGNVPASLQASLNQPTVGGISMGNLLLFGGIGVVALLVLSRK